MNASDEQEPVQVRLQPWSIKSNASCVHYHRNSWDGSEPFCAATFDNIMCWPPSESGSTVKLPCPPFKGIDPSKFAYKSCSDDGRWSGKSPDDFSRPQGYTNYSNCFLPVLKNLLEKLGSDEERKLKFMIAEGTRTMELIGWSISLLSLLVSLFIFFHFKKLQNHRTRIHRNLFVAMLIQVLVRLTVYVDQAIVRKPDVGDHRRGIDNTPVLCETFYTMIEYGRTSMFMWMFIEGLYLNNLVSVPFFQGPISYTLYYLLGWGLPMLMTALWALVTAIYHQTQCWWGYSFTPFYWVLEGPRFTVIAVNILFLLNILRILITKLRGPHENPREAAKVKKSVRAALVLLPLLGITNSFNMMTSPVHRSPLEFGLWSYITTFLRSCQGLFVCCIYCFFNDEVKRTLRHFWRLKAAARRGGRRRSTRTASLFDNPSLLELARRETGLAVRLHASRDSQVTLSSGRRAVVGLGVGREQAEL
ncbi:PDF receptor-like [Pollicipes pollicipes]|uniref:PDF receptor-like n=1 Tax=Pollicipes pollicipes TaxID=41117 RepID=UPI001884C9E2|nr:PDF receptor-like [Pollicipes pollicipes]